MVVSCAEKNKSIDHRLNVFSDSPVHEVLSDEVHLRDRRHVNSHRPLPAFLSEVTRRPEGGRAAQRSSSENCRPSGGIDQLVKLVRRRRRVQVNERNCCSR